MHFYDSLNTLLILSPGYKFFCAKFVQFPLMINAKDVWFCFIPIA